MTQVNQSWGLFDHQFFNATGEDHFLESKILLGFAGYEKQQPHTFKQSKQKQKTSQKVAAGQLASRKDNCIVQIHRINAVVFFSVQRLHGFRQVV